MKRNENRRIKENLNDQIQFILKQKNEYANAVKEVAEMHLKNEQLLEAIEKLREMSDSWNNVEIMPHDFCMKYQRLYFRIATNLIPLVSSLKNKFKQEFRRI